MSGNTDRQREREQGRTGARDFEDTKTPSESAHRSRRQRQLPKRRRRVAYWTYGHR
jgi:hypothetical protein